MVFFLSAKEDPTLRLRPIDFTNPVHGCTDRAPPVSLTGEGDQAAMLPKILDTDETPEDFLEFSGRITSVWIDFPTHLFIAVLRAHEQTRMVAIQKFGVR